MKLTTNLLVSLVVLWKSMSTKSSTIPPTSGPTETRCIISNDVYGTVKDLRNVTWTVVNATEGNVSVRFPFLKQSATKCPKEYELILWVKDGLGFKYHSMHTIWITSNTSKYSSNFCGKEAEVTFTHVYTGTYKLVIKLGMCAVKDLSVTTDIVTDYKRDPEPEDWFGRIITKHMMQKMEITVNIDTHQMFYELKYIESCFEPCQNESSVTATCNWGVHEEVEQNYKDMCIVTGCSLITGTTVNCSWTVESKPQENYEVIPSCGGRVKGKYSAKDKQYTIQIENITKGCYCIKTEKLDPRKDGQDSVWGNICKMAYSPFVYVDPGEVNIKPLPVVDPMPIALIVFLCCVAIFLPMMLWILRKHLRDMYKRLGKGNTNPEEDKDCTKAEILLLYPHDCEPFMVLMKQFKKLLRATCKCEVLDYHDHEHSAEIDRIGSSWLLQKITSPTTKIVLVENICSMLYQQAHFDGITIKPTEPQSRDNFFTLALIQLTSNKRRVFVIRFYDGLVEEARLRCISNGVRYVMPAHLKKLIFAMGFYGSEKDVQIDQNMEMALKNKTNDFITYVKNNKDYVIHLYKKC